MLDVLAIVSLFTLFSLGIVYTRGCDHLKGTRP